MTKSAIKVPWKALFSLSVVLLLAATVVVFFGRSQAIVAAGLFLFALLGSVVLFGLLESTGVVTTRNYQFGGAAAGLIVLCGILLPFARDNRVDVAGTLTLDGVPVTTGAVILENLDIREKSVSFSSDDPGRFSFKRVPQPRSLIRLRVELPGYLPRVYTCRPSACTDLSVNWTSSELTAAPPTPLSAAAQATLRQVAKAVHGLLTPFALLVADQAHVRFSDVQGSEAAVVALTNFVGVSLDELVSNPEHLGVYDVLRAPGFQEGFNSYRFSDRPTLITNAHSWDTVFRRTALLSARDIAASTPQLNKFTSDSELLAAVNVLNEDWLVNRLRSLDERNFAEDGIEAYLRLNGILPKHQETVLGDFLDKAREVHVAVLRVFSAG